MLLLSIPAFRWENYGKNTGSYNLDNAKRTIFIDSDAGEGDDSKWSIYFAGDSMMWRGVGSERQENTRLVHIKVE